MSLATDSLSHKSALSLSLFVSHETLFTKRNSQSDDSKYTPSSPPLPPFSPLPLSFFLPPSQGGRGPSLYFLNLLHPYRKKAIKSAVQRSQKVTLNRPTQSIMYVPLQVNRSQKCILLIVQYKYIKSCSGDFNGPNLILRTILCGTGFITQPSCLLDFQLTESVRWK